MIVDDKITDEKIQYGFNRGAVKISALLSGKFDKYEFLKGEEICSASGKAFGKQIKTTKNQVKKKIKPLEEQENNQLNLILGTHKKVISDH